MKQKRAGPAKPQWITSLTDRPCDHARPHQSAARHATPHPALLGRPSPCPNRLAAMQGEHRVPCRRRASGPLPQASIGSPATGEHRVQWRAVAMGGIPWDAQGGGRGGTDSCAAAASLALPRCLASASGGTDSFARVPALPRPRASHPCGTLGPRHACLAARLARCPALVSWNCSGTGNWELG
jgi:hypothetical protein